MTVIRGSVLDAVLEQARSGLRRVTPMELDELRKEGTDVVVVDIRQEPERLREGRIPGSVVVDRNVLEWRLEPRGEHALTDVLIEPDTLVVIVCNDGYASSLAAESLQRIGLCRATDLVGGHRAWVRSGRPALT